MTNRPNLCLHCEGKLTGRLDKKFCDAQCRSNFHNQHKRKQERIIAAVNRQIRLNRSILRKLCPEGKATVRKEKLVESGFSFQYCSSVYREGKWTYYFCYEYGYAPIMQRSRTNGEVVAKVMIVQSQQNMKGKFDPWMSN